MMWTTPTNQWRRWFAWLPVCLHSGPCKTCVWLQRYWYRPCGDCTEVSFTDPTKAQAAISGAAGVGSE